jgi:hippurate hydrolase
VGTFNAGTASNVIAGQARLTGTIRSQHEDVREHLHRAIERIAMSIGQLHGAEVRVHIDKRTPPLVNRGIAVQLARRAAREALGPDSVTELHTANMGGEDFAHFLEQVPGCYIRFGSQVPDLENQPAHSSRFDIDERVLGAGAAWFQRVAHLASSYLRDCHD